MAYFNPVNYLVIPAAAADKNVSQHFLQIHETSHAYIIGNGETPKKTKAETYNINYYHF